MSVAFQGMIRDRSGKPSAKSKLVAKELPPFCYRNWKRRLKSRLRIGFFFERRSRQNQTRCRPSLLFSPHRLSNDPFLKVRPEIERSNVQDRFGESAVLLLLCFLFCFFSLCFFCSFCSFCCFFRSSPCTFRIRTDTFVHQNKIGGFYP